MTDDEYTELFQEIALDIARKGSMALHITHEWDHTKEQGIWCKDCEAWVLKFS